MLILQICTIITNYYYEQVDYSLRYDLLVLQMDIEVDMLLCFVHMTLLSDNLSVIKLIAEPECGE